MHSDFTIGAIGCGIAGVLIHVFVSIRRSKRDLREYLEPPLRDCGVEFVSAGAPKRRMFNSGPFPKVEFEIGRPQSEIAGVGGEYNEYKIVSFRDSAGKTHELWAIVQFEAFKFRRVRWRAEQKESLPPEIRSILEN